jgi:predicted GIY-YIG superfamily endonuclease
MPYFTYMIMFDSGYLYTGQTKRLRNRVREHWRKGGHPQVIWRQSFETRREAVEREKQLKGWKRSKKLALAANDEASLQSLSRRRAGKLPNWQALESYSLVPASYESPV